MRVLKLLTVAFLLNFLQTGSGDNTQLGFSVWVAPSLQRIGRGDSPGSATKVQLSAARGEYESFQIGIRAGQNALTNVTVSVSDLQGPAGQSIGKSNISLFREQYVNVNPGSPDRSGPNRPLGSGWYADGLIPFVDPASGAPPAGGVLKAAPFDLPAGENQPIWVDAFVPRSAPAGQYTGSYTVASDQGTFTSDITVDVWNFTLPLRPSFKTAFLLWKATDRYSQEALLRNKVSATNTSDRDAADLVDAYGLSAVNLGFWSGADGQNCKMSPPPPPERLQQAASKMHPDLFLYNYTADEIGQCTFLYPLVKQWGFNLHQAGVKNLITMSPQPSLYDDGSGTGRSAVDIWVVLPKMYDRAADRIPEVLKKGDEVWSYNALAQDNYSPKWLIDYAPINFRIQPGFISQSLQLTGLLYWRVDLWSKDPWNQVNSTQQTNYPGDGMLVYPGQQCGIRGVAPSMRLKWIRDGIEDYEYVEYMKRLGQSGQALQIARGVGQDWSHWTRDIDALANARYQLGETISKLSSETVSAAAAFNFKADPASGNGSSQNFTFSFSNTNAAAEMSGVNVLINSDPGGKSACWIYYDRGANTVALARDDVSAWDMMTLDSGATLENSQCIVASDGASVATSPNSITLQLPLFFKPQFAGEKTIYLRAQSAGGVTSDYQAAGTWTVPGAQQ